MIQRYVLSLAVPDEPTMKRSEFGAYVLHADVAALEVEAAELRSRNANLLEALRQQTEAAARATAKLADVEAEAEGAHNLIDTLSEILTNTANVLKGPPGELKMHSWHDLAEVARARLASFSAFADKHGEPRKVLGTLPVSKDGYVMGSGSAVWVVDAGEVSSGRIDWIGWTEEVGSDTAFWNVSECYSTETAALAAKEAGNGK